MGPTRACAAIMVLFALGPAWAPAWAEEESDNGTGSACVDVQIGADRSYACLNDALARFSEQQHRVPRPQGLTHTSPAPAVGAYNQAATREHLGNAFGRSAYPQRPPVPNWVNPLVPPAAR